MKQKPKVWNLLKATTKKKIKLEEIINTLLKNRGLNTLKQKTLFLNPPSPLTISLKEVGLKEKEIKKAINRIKAAIKNKEKIIVYGDYDADGVCATAILWETLYSLGADVLPYIPERFDEGYGLNTNSLENLKKKYPTLGLIVTVDHGIVAAGKVEYAKEMGLDVIVTDHHQPEKKLPKPVSLIHTTKTSGSGVSWFLSRELVKTLDQKKKVLIEKKLELVAIGTLADQLTLLDTNRSLVKFGVQELQKTQRAGLLALFNVAGIEVKNIGTYEIGFVIAPRINAMGRLEHAIDALRLICTKNRKNANDLALHINKVNFERQKIVEEVVLHAESQMVNKKLKKVIILAHEEYHEGVIGLAAARLVEEYYRPAIVFTKKDKIAKASARSIPGFNIIKALRTQKDFLIDGGGHPMAAGFSIKLADIEKFTESFEKKVDLLIGNELFTKKLHIDTQIGFDSINEGLLSALKKFEPTGPGSPTPIFLTKKVKVVETKIIGKDSRHLKLKLASMDKNIDAIAFGFGDLSSRLEDSTIDVVYSVDENVWNGNRSLQLKIKDIKINFQ